MNSDWQNQHGERPDGGTGIDSAVGRPIGSPYAPKLGAAPKPPITPSLTRRTGRPAPGRADITPPSKVTAPSTVDTAPPIPPRAPDGGATRDDMRAPSRPPGRRGT